MSNSTATIQIPDNIPVSWLPNQPTMEPEMLMLVSVPSDKTETGFLSKYITYRDLITSIRSTFNFDILEDIFDQVSSEFIPLVDGLSTNVLKCNVSNPYVISSIAQKDGNIVELGGYRLSSMMDEIHSKVPMQTILAKKFEIAGYSGEPPIKSLFGYTLVEYKATDENVVIKCGHKTINYINYGIGKSNLIIQIKELNGDSKNALAATSLDFKVFVDNTNIMSIGNYTLNFAFLKNDYTVLTKSSSSNLTEVKKGERALYSFTQVGNRTIVVEKTELLEIP